MLIDLNRVEVSLYNEIKRTRALQRRVRRLQAENKRLRKALGPFAEAARDDDPDEVEVNELAKLTEGQLRVARHALDA